MSPTQVYLGFFHFFNFAKPLRECPIVSHVTTVPYSLDASPIITMAEKDHRRARMRCAMLRFYGTMLTDVLS